MADQENINFGALGLNLETSISQVKKGCWTYALNAIAEGFDGQSVNLQNEPGSQSCIEFPEGFKVIGKRAIYERNLIIWWLTNPTTKESQIGYSAIDGCAYTTKMDPVCLNFSVEHPILQAAHRISNCGLEIFWVDGYNPDRFFNWENLPFKEIPAVGQACGNTITTEIDCNKLNINPAFSIPKIDIVAIDSDGEIKSGTVQFAIQYANANGESYTSYYSITNPVPIFSISNVTLDFNSLVAKSVTLNISNIDTSGYYDYFNLAVIHTVNGITSPFLVGTYQINKSTETIVYTGQNTTQKALSLVEIAQKYPIYETSRIITTANDILIRADVKTIERLSYQEIANNIHLQWCRYRLPAVGFSNPLFATDFKGYLSDEVYAFELVLQLAKGIETDGFHIPGRKHNSIDILPIANDDTNNISLPQWKVYNTAVNLGYKDEWKSSTKTNSYIGPYDFGEFSYWESLETYPCEDQYGELKNQLIRHHKFPDNTVISINDDQNNIYPLGIQVDVKQILQLIANSSLTQEQKDEIVGFKIIRGNRTSNKSIVAKGILRNVGQYTKDGTTYLFPNYPYNSTQEDTFIANTSYPEGSKSRFTFQSPDTSFFQPTVSVGQILKLESALYGTSQGHFQQVKDHSKYKIYTDGLYLTALGVTAAIAIFSRVVGLVDTIIDGTAIFTTYQTLVDIFERTTPFVNYAYQYNSIGNYDKSKVIPNEGNKIRVLDSNQYVIDGFANVNDTYTLNNYNRESSVFLKTNLPLPLPSEIQGVPVDDSRYTPNCNPYAEVISKNINCYYGSIKKNNLQQYNQLYSYETVDTGFQVSFAKVDKQYYQIFGGDTFINKFSFKTKLRLFLDDGINKPDGTDLFFNEMGNVGAPRYWYSADIKGHDSGGLFEKFAGVLFGTREHHLDCDKSQFFYISGLMYLFAYGIPTFYCESEVNVDNRQAFNNKEGDFYPHVGTGIPDDWFQAINVPIAYDNTYYYNRTYSKQNKENVFTHLPLGWVPSQCVTYLPYRGVFSEDRTNNPLSLERNNWLIYKPSSYFDFPQNFGKLTSLDGIENRQVLARFENKSFVYNALLTAPTSQAQLYLGQSLFNSSVPPLDLSNTDQGFVGSRHKFIEKTEYGIVTVDDVRGQVFLINNNKPKNLTGADSGVEQFFNKNLEVQLPKYFPTLAIDNAFNFVGITGVYDAKYNRLILTKLDYIPLSKTITYKDGVFTEGTTVVELTDEKYFCNKSFTMSYDFDGQYWVGFHTYTQNFYVGSSNFYISGLNNGSKSVTYTHLINNQKYNTYNGVIAPYIIEYPFAYKFQDEILQSVQDYSKVFKYNEDDNYIETNDVYFNKCILYNNQQSSGILKLEPKPYRNMAEVMKYPKYNGDSKTITYTKSDNFYQINTFWSLVRDVKKPLFVKTCKSLSYDKEVNQDNMNYGKLSFGKAPLRAKDLRVRMILDDRDDARIVSQFIVAPTQTSYK